MDESCFPSAGNIMNDESIEHDNFSLNGAMPHD